MRRLMPGVGVLLSGSLSVLAAPWWVNYEGNVFPEEQAWTRVHGSTPAQRWIDDGVHFIDSRASNAIYDYYVMTFDHPVDPEGGETFLLSWRLKVDEEDGPLYDHSIGVTSDEADPNTFYRAGFGFREDRVLSAYEPDLWAPFEPGVFHDYEMRSSDMRTYELYIDGTRAITGPFTEVFGPTRVSWGDTAQGATSLTQWDFVSFGVVPEPGGFLGVLIAAISWARCPRDGSVGH
jgi:hypothetical protein